MTDTGRLYSPKPELQSLPIPGLPPRPRKPFSKEASDSMSSVVSLLQADYSALERRITSFQTKG